MNKIEFKALPSIFVSIFGLLVLILIPISMFNLSKNLYILSGNKRLFYPDSSFSPNPMKLLSNALAFDLIACSNVPSHGLQIVPVSEKPNNELS